MKTAAVILVGGRSRRMKTPKAELRFGNQSLLERTIQAVQPAVSRVVVVKAAGQSLPELHAGVEVIRDEREDQGPLEGLRVGFDAARQGAEAIFLCAVDAPFLRTAFVAQMFALLGRHDAVIPAVDGRSHPLTGCYRVAVAENATQLLGQGVRSLRELLAAIDTRFVGRDDLISADPTLASLENINTPEQYRAALARHEAGA